MAQPTLNLLNRRLLMLILPGAAILLAIRLGVPEATLREYPFLVNVWLAAYQDPYWLLFLALLVIAASRVDQLPRLAAALDRLRDWAASLTNPVPWLALATTLIVALGVDWVYHRFALSMDEYMLVWQARVYLAGHLLAPIPEGWGDLAKALQPIFTHIDQAHQLWYSDYLPLGAAIYALFDLAALGPWSNALLAGGSVALTAAIARRAWPEERHAPGLAALLLATSPQLLITAMSPYSMTAHLFFNLLWLWLFLADTRRGHLLAALVGLIAVGLHQPHVHPLFIAPFMLSLLWQRRWRLAFGYAAWYAAVLLLWIFWDDFATWWVTRGTVIGQHNAGVSGIGLLKSIPGMVANFQGLRAPLTLINLTRFLAWQSPLTLLLFIPALFGLCQAPYLVRMLIWSMLITLIGHIILMPGQGHGWGYRYLHVYLGAMALIGVWGWRWARQALSDRDWQTFTRVGTLLLLAGALVGQPLRARQTQAFVEPFAVTDAHIKQISADLVFIDPFESWFIVDLVRNDPLLRNSPRVMMLQQTPSLALKMVCPNKKVVLIDHAAIAHLGMRPRPENSNERPERMALQRRHLIANGCIPYDTPRSGTPLIPGVGLTTEEQIHQDPDKNPRSGFWSIAPDG